MSDITSVQVYTMEATDRNFYSENETDPLEIATPCTLECVKQEITQDVNDNLSVEENKCTLDKIEDFEIESKVDIDKFLSTIPDNSDDFSNETSKFPSHSAGDEASKDSENYIMLPSGAKMEDMSSSSSSAADPSNFKERGKTSKIDAKGRRHFILLKNRSCTERSIENSLLSGSKKSGETTEVDVPNKNERYMKKQGSYRKQTGTKKKSLEDLLEIRRKATERKQEQREMIRQDPIKYAEARMKEKERSRRRRREGQIKSIDQLSERDKILQRKEWNRRNKLRMEKKLEEKKMLGLVRENPLSKSVVLEIVAPSSSKSFMKKRGPRQSREKCRKQIRVLEEAVGRYRRLSDKWKQRYQRLKNLMEKHWPISLS